MTRHETSQYDPTHAKTCGCNDCARVLRGRTYDALFNTRDAKPRMNRSPIRIGLAASLTITLTLALAFYAGTAWSREGATPKPMIIPASHAHARAVCPDDKPVACRAALIHAYEALSWTRKTRLHARTLPASALTPLEVGRELALRRGWSGRQFTCLAGLWSRESGWIPTKSNYAGSGAYGIPQALPGSKMASAGADWRTNPATQIRWGLGYIEARYGSPCSALAHSDTHGYY